jgi:thioredoxin reductase (NADPH)
MMVSNQEDCDVYDVAVIGSGPAGYTAAMYSSRFGLRTLLMQGFEMGGQLMLSSEVEDYPGAESGILGPDLMDRFEAQAARFGADMRPYNVERVDFSQRPFRLWQEGEDEPVLACSVIVATGARSRWLGLENEFRLMGRGVSNCATCDGFFFKDKRAAVVGGGDKAMEDALFLTTYASEVFVVHRHDTFRASWAMLQRVRENPKITFVTDTVVEDVLGEEAVEGLWLRNVNTEKRQDFAVEGVFVSIGSDPVTYLFRDQLQTDQGGYIVRREGTMTSVPGVFSAGEVSDSQYRQVATAVGDGARAAIDAQRWLETSDATR